VCLAPPGKREGGGERGFSLTQKWIVCGPAGWFQKARRRLARVAGAWEDMRGRVEHTREQKKGRKGGRPDERERERERERAGMRA
jgi:hypothetical protein